MPITCRAPPPPPSLGAMGAAVAALRGGVTQAEHGTHSGRTPAEVVHVGGTAAG